MTTQYWAMTTWANRESAEYVGIDRAIDNVVIDAYGRRSGTPFYGSGVPRRALKEEEGETTGYVMYDDDTAGPVPVIKVVES